MSNIPRSQVSPDTITFTHQSAFNQIVEPTKFVSLTQYFISHWLPKISPNGLRILITLRSMGYFNPQSGEKRGEIDIDQDALAALIGISPKTIQRAFADDLVLNKYVRRVFSVQRDRSGRIVKEHYVYVVTMDDVLTPEDQARYDRMVLGPDKGESRGEPKAANPPINLQTNSPNRQNVCSDDEPKRQVDASVGQSVLPKRQSVSPKGQSVSPYKVTPTLITKNTLTTPAAGSDYSLSLFVDKEAEKATENLSNPSTSCWEDLPEQQQQHYLDQAQQELVAIHAGSGIAPKPKLIEVRARNLYDIAQRKNNG